MTSGFNYKFIIVLLAVSMGTMACSKVRFSPTEEQDVIALDEPTPIPDVVIPEPQPEPEPEPDPVVVQPEPQPEPQPQPQPDPVVVVPPPPPPPPPPQPVSKSESFTQAAAPRKLDILFVMDNSDSMFMDYYYNIQTRFNGFLNTLSGLDYQIAVTTTDVERDGFGDTYGFWGLIDLLGSGFQKTGMRVLNAATSNANNLFLSTLKRDEVYDCRKNAPYNQLPCGSDNEQPLAAIARSVARASQNAGFYRSDAELITIAVSDEDEYSNGGSNVTQPSYVISKVRQYLGASKAYRAYGVVIPEGNSSCLSSQRNEEIFGQAANYGRLVSSLAQQTGGGVVSLCSSSYVSGLQSIAQGAWTQGALQSVTLSQTPVSGTVQVAMSPSNDITWNLSGKTITFASKPPAGTVINVSYKHMP